MSKSWFNLAKIKGFLSSSHKILISRGSCFKNLDLVLIKTHNLFIFWFSSKKFPSFMIFFNILLCSSFKKFGIKIFKLCPINSSLEYPIFPEISEEIFNIFPKLFLSREIIINWKWDEGNKFSILYILLFELSFEKSFLYFSNFSVNILSAFSLSFIISLKYKI